MLPRRLPVTLVPSDSTSQNEDKDRTREETQHCRNPRQTERRGLTRYTYVQMVPSHKVSNPAEVRSHRDYPALECRPQDRHGEPFYSYQTEMTAILLSLDYVTNLEVAHGPLLKSSQIPNPPCRKWLLVRAIVLEESQQNRENDFHLSPLALRHS